MIKHAVAKATSGRLHASYVVEYFHDFLVIKCLQQHTNVITMHAR